MKKLIFPPLAIVDMVKDLFLTSQENEAKREEEITKREQSRDWARVEINRMNRQADVLFYALENEYQLKERNSKEYIDLIRMGKNNRDYCMLEMGLNALLKSEQNSPLTKLLSSSQGGVLGIERKH